MRRDMNLIREILFAVEEKKDIDTPMPLLVNGYSDMEVLYHYKLLKEAKLITGEIMDAKPHVYTLTWDGHEFLDNARNEGVWKKTMEHIKEKGESASFQIVIELLKRIALRHFNIE